MSKDVHTEHCCNRHGCKYGDEDCPVETGQKEQSFPCEMCDSEESYQEYLGMRPETEKPIYFAVYRQESHPDKEVTFLGIFSSEAKAEEAIARHRATGKSLYYPDGWPEYEYAIRECTLDSGYI